MAIESEAAEHGSTMAAVAHMALPVVMAAASVVAVSKAMKG